VQRRRLTSGLGALALVLLCIALVMAMAPATWMARLLDAQSDGALVLTDPAGSLWSGRGHLALGDSRWSTPLGWSLSPLPLLWGHVDLKLALEGASGSPAHLMADGRGMALLATTLTIPAAALAGIWHQPLPVAVGGEIALATPGASLLDDVAAGEITLRWQHARLADSNGQVLDLGDVATTLRSRGAGFAGTLANNGGDATLSGDLVLSSRGSSVDLTLTPRDPRAAPFMRALALVGTPASGGGTRITWQARQP
jgi:hypothetical protein